MRHLLLSSCLLKPLLPSSGAKLVVAAAALPPEDGGAHLGQSPGRGRAGQQALAAAVGDFTPNLLPLPIIVEAETPN